MAEGALARAFEEEGWELEAGAAAAAGAVAREAGLRAADLVLEYDSWALGALAAADGGRVSAGALQRFGAHLRAARQKAPRIGRGNAPGAAAAKAAVALDELEAPPAQPPPGAGGAGAEGDPDFRLRTAVPVGGSKKRILADLPGMAPGRGFLDRVGRGQAKVLFGEGLQFGERADAPGRAAVEVVGGRAAQVPLAVRHLRDGLGDRARFVDGRIARLEAELRERGVECGRPVTVVANEPTVFVGWVCCDSEGRLNEASIMLEGGIQSSGGSRVRLDTSKLPADVSLFPGQVVAVEGVNPSGHCLIALRVLYGAPRPVPLSSPAELGAAAKRTGSAGLDLVVASGPFSTSEDLSYAPLEALLGQLHGGSGSAPPDLLVLVGPFVDREHPHVASGALDLTFRDLFLEKPRALIQQYCEAAGPGARVALLPAIRDAQHKAVFPQPALSAADFADLPAGQVTCVGNPGLFRVNELLVGCTSHDVLKHLSAAELQRGQAPGSDRLGRLAGHLLGQRSFYPLFPPAPGACLDSQVAARYPQALDLGAAGTPDLLILPSDLNPFAKRIRCAPMEAAAAGHEGPLREAARGAASAPGGAGELVCLNPGRLARGPTGGTFARLRVQPAAAGLDHAAGAPAATNGPQPHDLGARSRVEVVRV